MPSMETNVPQFLRDEVNRLQWDLSQIQHELIPHKIKTANPLQLNMYKKLTNKKIHSCLLLINTM
jgi:hypothetical protein